MNLKCIFILILYINLFNTYLSSIQNINSTNNDENIKNEQWNILYESSLKDKSMVNFLPNKKPLSFEGGYDQSSFFKSCFRIIRELLKKQWKEYKSIRNYKNHILIPNMIKIGENKKFSPPYSYEEGKEIFQHVKEFCIENVKKYFKLKEKHKKLLEKCIELNINPSNIKKFKRSMLPRDIRCRGENILLEMEKQDQKRDEEIKIAKENIDKLLKGELLPIEKNMSIYELLDKYSNNKDRLEILNYIENKELYDNWIKNDSKLTKKFENDYLNNNNSLFKKFFQIKYNKEDNQSNIFLNNEFNIEKLYLTKNNNNNSTIEKNYFPNKSKINQYNESINNLENKIIENNINNEFDILLSEKKELGLSTIPYQDKYYKSKSLINPQKYYLKNHNFNFNNIDNYNKNIHYENNSNLNLINHPYKFKIIKDYNTRDANKLVPLKETYMIPDIYKTNYSEFNKNNEEISPLGFDKFGLLKLPSKERTKFEYENRLKFTNINKDRFGKIILNPLPINNSEDEKVFYINIGGISKVIPNYNLNPSNKNNFYQQKEKYYEKDEYMKDILKDFLKTIDKKRKKQKIFKNNFKNNQYNDDIIKQRVKNAYEIYMNPKIKRKIVPPQEFAPLEDLKDITALGAIRNNNQDIKIDKKISNSKIYSDNKKSSNNLSDNSNLNLDISKHKIVRFQIPEDEEKVKKKYVSPPPHDNDDDNDDDDDDNNDDNDDYYNENFSDEYK